MQDVLCLLFQLLRIARASPVELEEHIESPGASPIFQATVGAAGPAMTSQSLKACWKSSAIMRRTFCACR